MVDVSRGVTPTRGQDLPSSFVFTRSGDWSSGLLLISPFYTGLGSFCPDTELGADPEVGVSLGVTLTWG